MKVHYARAAFLGLCMLQVTVLTAKDAATRRNISDEQHLCNKISSVIQLIEHELDRIHFESGSVHAKKLYELKKRYEHVFRRLLSPAPRTPDGHLSAGRCVLNLPAPGGKGQYCSWKISVTSSHEDFDELLRIAHESALLRRESDDCGTLRAHCESMMNVLYYALATVLVPAGVAYYVAKGANGDSS